MFLYFFLILVYICVVSTCTYHVNRKKIREQIFSLNVAESTICLFEHFLTNRFLSRKFYDFLIFWKTKIILINKYRDLLLINPFKLFSFIFVFIKVFAELSNNNVTLFIHYSRWSFETYYNTYDNKIDICVMDIHLHFHMKISKKHIFNRILRLSKYSVVWWN